MNAHITSDISPVFRYRDAQGAIEWLCRAFGFETQSKALAPDGSIAHAELRLAGGVIALSSSGHEVAGNPWSHVRQGVYVCVPDVDTHFERAREAGADIAAAPANMDYGSREYSARDSGGHLWSFGTYAMCSAKAPNIFPCLLYDDCAAAAGFLTRAFGFAPVLEVPDRSGGLMHVELRLGAGLVMLGSRAGEHAQPPGTLQSTHVRIGDPDQHCAHARAAGAAIEQPPKDTSYGARGYCARDPEGFLWGFSTYEPAALRAASSHGRVASA